MTAGSNLNRFIEAQKNDYQKALTEIKNGKKRSHWMWYIFPQIKGLGFSETSKYYAIASLEEAAAYLEHPVLGLRLVEICNVLLSLNTDDPYQIFGSPDDVKLRSSMTLFAAIKGDNQVFQEVLEKFFDGITDDKTLQLIAKVE